MKLLFSLGILLLTFSSHAVDEAAGYSAPLYEAQEDSQDRKLQVQEEVYVPWRTLDLQKVHKETLEEVLAEQDAQADKVADDDPLAN